MNYICGCPCDGTFKWYVKYVTTKHRVGPGPEPIGINGEYLSLFRSTVETTTKYAYCEVHNVAVGYWEHGNWYSCS